MTAIYLDYNATTPVDPQVLEAMLPFLRGEFGNPSSSYALGRRAHAAVEQARAEVAALIGAAPEEIVFTGGATEASNIAIRGAAALTRANRRRHQHHRAPGDRRLLQPPAAAGSRDPSRAGRTQRHRRTRELAAAIDDRTALVTVIHAQNEIGTLQPVAEIARAAKARGALVHTDAAQSVGKIPVDVKELGVDLLTIAGHKLYAPKGIGALFVRRGLSLPPVIVGAGQEHGVRPGTENVAFIVGLGAACRIAGAALERSRKPWPNARPPCFRCCRRKFPASRWSAIPCSACRIRSTCCSPTSPDGSCWRPAAACSPPPARLVMPTARSHLLS